MHNNEYQTLPQVDVGSQARALINNRVNELRNIISEHVATYNRDHEYFLKICKEYTQTYNAMDVLSGYSRVRDIFPPEETK